MSLINLHAHNLNTFIETVIADQVVRKKCLASLLQIHYLLIHSICRFDFSLVVFRSIVSCNNQVSEFLNIIVLKWFWKTFISIYIPNFSSYQKFSLLIA